MSSAPAGRAAHRLPAGAVVVLMLVVLVWGGNMAAIKVASRGFSPLFLAGVRSAVASACLWVWMRATGVPLFPTRTLVVHGLVVGAMFGVEFGSIYLGLQHTLASRAYLLLYTQPFFTALGAHWFLHGDPLSGRKVAGLVLAFAGVATLFAGGWGATSLDTLPGDLLLLGCGALWAATNLYIKRFLAGRAVPLQTLFYQLFFSAPLLFGLSLATEPHPWFAWSAPIGLALAYQCLVVAFVSYLIWFELLHRYPVSVVAGFTFFTPVFGVWVSGVWILGEPVSAGMIVALTLVSAGMVLVNRPERIVRNRSRSV